MNLFRKLLLATVAGLALLLPVTAASASQRPVMRPAMPSRTTFVVYYRWDCSSPWQLDSTYGNRLSAVQRVNYIQAAYGVEGTIIARR